MARSESKAAGIYLYSRTAAGLLLVVTVILAARLYGTLGFAYVSALILIYETATALGTLGLPESVIYFVGREPARASAIVRQTSGILFGAAVPVIGAVVIAGYAMSAGELDLVPALPWLALLLVLDLPTQPMVNELLAGGHAAMASVLFVSFVALRTLAVLVPLFTGGSLVTIAVAMAATGVLRIAVHVILLRVYYPLRRGERWLIPKEMRAILMFALPAGLGATVGRINPQVDKYVVEFLLGARAFAVYNVAAWELPLVTLIPYAIGAVMQVRYVQLYAAGQKEELRRVWYHNVEKTMLIVVPLAMLAIVVADDLVAVLFGDRYAGAVTPFRIFTVLLFHRVAAYGPLLQSIGKTRVLLTTSLSMLISNLVLTLPLTWLIGTSGAALATVLSAIPPWFICLSFIGRAWGRGMVDALPWRFYGAVMALAVASGVAVWLAVRALALPAGAGMAVAAGGMLVLYVGAGRLSGLIHADDLAFLRRWLSFGLVR